jgi:hypothetical protein
MLRTSGVARPPNKGMKLTRPERIGALQLIPGVRPTCREKAMTNSFRAALILLACAIAFGCRTKEDPLPAVKQQQQAVVPEPCMPLPPPPPEMILRPSDPAACIPASFTSPFLPLEITVAEGKITTFRFYSSCEGVVYPVAPSVRDRVRRSLDTWRYDVAFRTCPGEVGSAERPWTVQLYLEPARRVKGQLREARVGPGCAGRLDHRGGRTRG